jgi:hypothetical protein
MKYYVGVAFISVVNGKIPRPGIHGVDCGRFHEMCIEGQTMDALKFLQVELGQLVNHEDEKESMDFRSLTSSLFEPCTSTSPFG